MFANKIQVMIPMMGGRIAASPVHFQLLVSFLMVSKVVEQGQCSKEKSMVLIAVIHVHP